MPKPIIYCAVDFGSYTIKGILAKQEKNLASIEIISTLTIPSFGIRNGEIAKPEIVKEKFNNLIKSLEEKSGYKINQIFLNVSGKNLTIEDSKNLITISHPDRRIQKEDIDRLLDQAENVNLLSNQLFLDFLNKEFILDDKGGIKNPLNLQGQKLELKCKKILCFSQVMENLEKITEDIEAEEIFIPSPLATARAVLDQESVELGAIAIDFGAGQTTIIFAKNGEIFHFLIIPFGFSEITNDLAIAFRTDIKTAEKIKQKYASISTKKIPKKIKEKDKILLPEESLIISKKIIKDLVQKHVNKILSELQKELKRVSKNISFPAGIVLTGGGTKLNGILDYTKSFFKLPTRIGKNTEINANFDVEYLNCLGLLLKGIESLKFEITENSGIISKIKRMLKSFSP
ncbi:MAG: cell division protein FtsA [Minisyncoccia bacterium]